MLTLFDNHCIVHKINPQKHVYQIRVMRRTQRRGHNKVLVVLKRTLTRSNYDFNSITVGVFHVTPPVITSLP